MDKLDAKQRNTLWFGLTLLALSYMSIKLSVPALPLLQTIFHVHPIYLQTSATVFLCCIACSQLIWGGVAKFLPRKRVIQISLSIATIATVLAALSTNVWMFIIARAIEGLGMGVASPICRVMMVDRLNKMEIARASFFFGIIFNFAPFVAPTMGQYIILVSNWRIIFFFFLALLLIYLVLLQFKYDESHSGSANLSVKNVLHSYRVVITNRLFWLYVMGTVLFAGTKIAYYMAIPYWFMVHFHFSEKFYTFLALWTAMPNLLAYYLGRFAIAKYGTTKTLMRTYTFALLAIPVSVYFALQGKTSISSFICPLVITAIAAGFIQPSVNAGLLTLLKDQAGAVGALIPVLPFFYSAMMFIVFTNIPLDTLWPFTIIISTIVILGFIMGLCITATSAEKTHE